MMPLWFGHPQHLSKAPVGGSVVVSNSVPGKYQDYYFFHEGKLNSAPFDLKFCVLQLHYVH